LFSDTVSTPPTGKYNIKTSAVVLLLDYPLILRLEQDQGLIFCSVCGTDEKPTGGEPVLSIEPFENKIKPAS